MRVVLDCVVRKAFTLLLWGSEMVFPEFTKLITKPLYDGTRNFVYADELCVTAQYPSFTEVEHTIEEALDELTTYDKTQVTSFHLDERGS